MSYSLDRNFLPTETVLETMNEVQLEAVLSLVSSIYNYASDESRKYWAPKYHEQRELAEKVKGA